jgi:multisubunit Na+/H+ antiporter MnhB subunit
VRLAGLFLVVGAAFTLVLHFLSAPESLYEWLYHHLLSGLDVPKEPSQGTVDLVSYFSLIGGLLELIAGVAVLAIDRLREASSEVG